MTPGRPVVNGPPGGVPGGPSGGVAAYVPRVTAYLPWYAS